MVVVERLWRVQVVCCEVLVQEIGIIKNDFNFHCCSNYSKGLQTFVFVILINDRDFYNSIRQ